MMAKATRGGSTLFETICYTKGSSMKRKMYHFISALIVTELCVFFTFILCPHNEQFRRESVFSFVCFTEYTFVPSNPVTSSSRRSPSCGFDHVACSLQSCCSLMRRAFWKLVVQRRHLPQRWWPN